jgi:hypothetical protein
MVVWKWWRGGWGCGSLEGGVMCLSWRVVSDFELKTKPVG